MQRRHGLGANATAKAIAHDKVRARAQLGCCSRPARHARLSMQTASVTASFRQGNTTVSSTGELCAAVDSMPVATAVRSRAS